MQKHEGNVAKVKGIQKNEQDCLVYELPLTQLIMKHYNEYTLSHCQLHLTHWYIMQSLPN